MVGPSRKRSKSGIHTYFTSVSGGASRPTEDLLFPGLDDPTLMLAAGKDRCGGCVPRTHSRNRTHPPPIGAAATARLSSGREGSSRREG